MFNTTRNQKIPDGGDELVLAARSFVGRPAGYHQRRSGDCISAATDVCQTIGIGPKEFDCSGLVIAAACSVVGVSPAEWPIAERHVRDMWRSAEGISVRFRIAELHVGGLLVSSCRYTIAGREHAIPGHVGVISALQGGVIQLIHANPAHGIVEEEVVTNPGMILGVLAVDLSTVVSPLVYTGAEKIAV